MAVALASEVVADASMRHHGARQSPRAAIVALASMPERHGGRRWGRAGLSRFRRQRCPWPSPPNVRSIRSLRLCHWWPGGARLRCDLPLREPEAEEVIATLESDSLHLRPVLVPRAQLDEHAFACVGAYRIKQLGGGRAKYRVMTALELLARLAALVPPPRYPLVRYHGVLAPRSAWRRSSFPVHQPTRSGRGSNHARLQPIALGGPGSKRQRLRWQ
jgi:Putative transposase